MKDNILVLLGFFLKKIRIQGFSSPKTHNTAPQGHNPRLSSSYGVPSPRRTVWTPVPRSPSPLSYKPRGGPPSFLHLPSHICPEPLPVNPFPLIPQHTLESGCWAHSAQQPREEEANPPAVPKSPPTLNSEMPPVPSLTTPSFVHKCHFLSGPLHSSRSSLFPSQHSPSSHAI